MSQERKKYVSGRPKAVNEREVRQIHRLCATNPHSTSKAIFEEAGVENVSKGTRNRG